MGRNQYHHSQRKKDKRDALFIPDYDHAWLVYDPKDPQSPCKEMTWTDAWEIEEGRDFIHRLNSKFLARYISDSPNVESNSRTYSTMALVLCFVIIVCIIVPQIFQIISSLFSRQKRPPPTPPSPPQLPTTRKRLRFYYFRKTKGDTGFPPSK